MRSFLKYVLATFVGVMIFFIVGVILFFGGISSLIPEEKEIPDNAVLQITLDNKIVERESDDLFARISDPLRDASGNIGLLELKRAIKEAENNDDIKGIYLDMVRIGGGMAVIEELRNALLKFKESGKFVVAYSGLYRENSYYLASVADKIYLPPSGLLEFNGMGTELIFFKRLLEQLEIEPVVFKQGEYKSAVEPFMAEEMSDANRRQMETLLNSIYNYQLSNIGESRNIDAARLRMISDSMLVRKPADALQYKLVTDVDYYAAAEAYMKSELEIEEDEDVNFVSYMDLIDQEHGDGEGSDKVAVIYAVGDIIDGVGGDLSIGSQTMAEEIRRVRQDDEVKAVVLRVNSPGGSAMASDIIWNEVKMTNDVKPVITSMSDMAASGGYFISAPSRKIFAHPTTITGSIGVFGVFFNGDDFIEEKLYINTDRVSTGPYADLGSFTRDIRPEEKEIVQEEISRIYREFKEVVAEGRNMSTDEVEQIAQGRVWSGVNALDTNLVDEYGGLDDAVAAAAEEAGIEDYEVVFLPEQDLFMKRMLNRLGKQETEALIKEELGELAPYYEGTKRMMEMRGIQMRMPFQLKIY